MLQQSFVMVKPDGLARGLAGEVVRRLERRGLRLVAAKVLSISRELAERHYEMHRARPFFGELVDFITSGPVLAMVWEGPQAVDAIRATMGATDPAKAAPGTLRADLAVTISKNIVHGSDSVESAKREIGLFFRPEEIVPYERPIDRWVF